MVMLGKFVPGTFKVLSPGVPLALGDRVYEIRVETTPMAPDKEALIASRLMDLRLSNIKVIGVKAEGSEVRLQATANSFSISALIAILPTIIWPLIAALVGVILVMRVPDWAIAAPFLAAGGALLIYSFYKAK